MLKQNSNTQSELLYPVRTSIPKQNFYTQTELLYPVRADTQNLDASNVVA